ncbi:protein kinase [Streptomyces sp. NPDC050287]|uniref:serine/threonine-protein kinase n=1 Tax=Streptomyces sp. NPDC050287 TaxID=3365608 RepID=UPI00378B3661
MGEVFAGRYELADPIGRGGVGAVWRAWDHRRRRYVAAKVLQQRDAHSLLRFVREQALRIDHPHVLAPASWAADDDKVLFTMDLVAGGSLVHLIGDYGPLPAPFVCVLLDQLLSGLAAVHAEGVVHRDIKPANILLEATGTARPRLRLSDFGIAMRLGEPRLTETNLVVGTPGYIAPEQMMGAEPDFPADLFAVGLVALYLLEGAKPDAKALVQYFATHGTPSAPQGIPEPLWQVVASMLQPDPQARFRTATGARKALASAVELLPDTSPDDELIEIFDQLGPLPAGFAPEGPLKQAPGVDPGRTASVTRPARAGEGDGGGSLPSGIPAAGFPGAGTTGARATGGDMTGGGGRDSSRSEHGLPPGHGMPSGQGSGPAAGRAGGEPSGSPGAGPRAAWPGSVGSGTDSGGSESGQVGSGLDGSAWADRVDSGPGGWLPDDSAGFAPGGSLPGNSAGSMPGGSGSSERNITGSPGEAGEERLDPSAGGGSWPSGAGDYRWSETGGSNPSGSPAGVVPNDPRHGTGPLPEPYNNPAPRPAGASFHPSHADVPPSGPASRPPADNPAVPPPPSEPPTPAQPTPMSDTGSFHLPPPQSTTSSPRAPVTPVTPPQQRYPQPHPAPQPQPQPQPQRRPPRHAAPLSAHDPTHVLSSPQRSAPRYSAQHAPVPTPSRHQRAEPSTASYTAEVPQVPPPAQAISRSPRRSGPPAQVAIAILLVALACYAVGFWALTRL